MDYNLVDYSGTPDASTDIWLRCILLTGEPCVRCQHHSHHVDQAEREKDRRGCQISVNRTNQGIIKKILELHKDGVPQRGPLAEPR